MPDLTPDELLTTTRAVRRRLDFERPVERSVVEECLEMALQAPTGSGLTLWHWIIVDDPALIGGAAQIYRDAQDLAITQPNEQLRGDVPGRDRILESARDLSARLDRCPVLAFPLLKGRVEQADLFMRATLWGSILPAVWSFMLALRTRGLGSAWTTAHLLKERDMASLLGLDPQAWTQVGLFPVAYTQGTRFRRAYRPALSEVLSWNRLDGTESA